VPRRAPFLRSTLRRVAKKHNILNPELDEVLLRGPAFEEWMRKHPEAAKSWLASPAGQAHAEQIALRNKKKY